MFTIFTLSQIGRLLFLVTPSFMRFFSFMLVYFYYWSQNAPSRQSNNLVANVYDSIHGELIATTISSATAVRPATWSQISSFLHPHFGPILEQLDAKFTFEKGRAEAELAVVEARTLRENKKSSARIVAIESAAIITAALRNRMDKEDLTSDISLATLLLPANIAIFPKPKSRILSNKFRQENFYKLWPLKKREEKNRYKNITNDNWVMKL